MSQRTTSIYPPSERRNQDPSRLRSVVLRDGMQDWVELPSLPLELLTVSNLFNWLFRVECGQTWKTRILCCMFPNSFVYGKVRQIFSVKILAGRPLGAPDDGFMLQAKTRTSANHQTLATVMDAIAATEQLFHQPTRVKYS